MPSYKIYLSKSSEVVNLIAKGHNVGDDILSVSHGAIICDKGNIPEIYHKCGYFQCTVKYYTPEDKNPKYEIIFA